MTEGGLNPEEPISTGEEGDKHSKAPRRLMFSLRANLELVIGNAGNLEVVGRENLQQIPSDKKVVIACTHLSDVDVQVAAYALGNDFNLMISHHSFHDDFSKDPVSYMGTFISGRKNFLPIKARIRDGKITESFSPDDFETMKRVTDKGKTIVIAAHNRTTDWKLAASGGFGPVYLAQMLDAAILPVAVDIDSPKPIGMGGDFSAILKNLSKRPMARVAIGRPLVLDSVEAERLGEVVAKRAEGKGSTALENQEFRSIRGQLNQQSSDLMRTLASMLPQSKRGNW